MKNSEVDRSERFMACVRAFSAGEFASCAQDLKALGNDGWTIDAALLFLLSLRYCGLREKMQHVGEEFLRAFADRTWDRRLLELTLGTLKLGELLSDAQDDRQRCQALFYAGEQALGSARLDDAISYLAECIKTSSNCLESQLAALTLEAISAFPSLEQELHRSELSLDEHVSAGRLECARTASAKVADLGQKLHGQTIPYALLLSRLGSKLVAQDYEAAIPLLTESLRIKRQHGADTNSVVIGIHNLAVALQAAKEFDEAAVLYEDELKLACIETSEDLWNRLMTVTSLCDVYRQLGQLADGERVRRSEGRLLSRPDKRELAENVLNSAVSQAIVDSHNAAAADFARIVLNNERERPSRRPEIITDMALVAGSAMMQLESIDEVLPLLRDVFQECQVDGGPEPKKFAQLQDLLAVALHIKGQQIRDTDANLTISYFSESLRTLGWNSKNPLRYAQISHDLARLLRDRGDLDEAEAYFLEALDILQSEEAPPLAGLVAVKNGLGFLHLKKKSYETAKSFFEAALDLAPSAGVEIATLLINLGHVSVGQNKNADACLLYEKAVSASESVAALLIPALQGWANSLFQLGQLEKADAVSSQLLELLVSQGEPRRAELAQANLNLGIVRRLRGKYDDARALFEYALDLSEPGTGDRISILEALGLLNIRVGNYIEAARMLHECHAVRLRLGSTVDIAICLNSLGALYEALQALPKAIAYYEEAHGLLLDTEGVVTFFLSVTHNLALARAKAGELQEAIASFEEVIHLSRLHGTDTRPTFSGVLVNLGEIYALVGTGGAQSGLPGEKWYALAESKYREALEVLERSGSQGTQGGITVRYALAWLAYCRGNHAESERLYAVAKSQWSNLGFGSEVLKRADSNFACVLAATDRHADAMALMLKQALYEDDLIDHVFSLTSESQKLEYMRRWRGDVWGLVSLALSSPPAAENLVSVMNVVLRRKGLVADSVAARRHTPASDAQTSKLSEIAAIREMEENAFLGHPRPLEPQEDVESLRKRREQLEGEMSDGWAVHVGVKTIREANCASLAVQLPPGSALIEVLRMPIYDYKAVPARGEPKWGLPRYLAFILLADHPDEVMLVDLGDASETEALVDDWIRSCSVGSSARHLGHTAMNSGADWTSAGKALRQRIFDPMLSVIASCQRLFIAPDGALNRVPFGGLTSDSGGFLMDHFQISYLSTGRDLLRNTRPSAGRKKGAPVIAAAPQFDLGAEPAGVHVLPELDRGVDLSKMFFTPLPGTAREGQAIARLLGVPALLGESVVEQAIRSIESPAILHIATHGYFLEDPQNLKDDEALPNTMNPLLLSGLALSGANWRTQGFLPPLAAGDGLLTAADLAHMDLQDTELVVLSACDTGLGSIQAGEGVFGFRRSFVLAGAETVLMSLWRVPDEQTSELMSHFYTALLKGLGRAESLCEAQLIIRRSHPSPFFWAAFICQGETGPLSWTPEGQPSEILRQV